MRSICTVGVMGSGKEPWVEYATPLGALVAELGANLLTGGGGGTMAAVTRAYIQAPRKGGVAIGVLPTFLDSQGRYVCKAGYPNEWVEVCITTPLGGYDPRMPQEISRNHINILSSDVVVALPGGEGTSNELRLALQFERPAIFLGPPEKFEALILSAEERKALRNSQYLVL